MLSEQHLCWQFHQENYLSSTSTEHRPEALSSQFNRCYVEYINNAWWDTTKSIVPTTTSQESESAVEETDWYWVHWGENMDIYCIQVTARRRTENELSISNWSVLDMCISHTAPILLSLYSCTDGILIHRSCTEWAIAQMQMSRSLNAYLCYIGISGPTVS